MSKCARTVSKCLAIIIVGVLFAVFAETQSAHAEERGFNCNNHPNPDVRRSLTLCNSIEYLPFWVVGITERGLGFILV
jgi:hypothetical protein